MVRAEREEDSMSAACYVSSPYSAIYVHILLAFDSHLATLIRPRIERVQSIVSDDTKWSMTIRLKVGKMDEHRM